MMNTSPARETWPFRLAATQGLRSDLSVFAVVLVCYVAGASAAWHSFGATADLAFFPPAGVTVAAMVLLPRRRWWLVVAAIVVGESGVDLANGLSVALSAGYVAANVVEPLVGASLFVWFTQGDTRLDRRGGMRWFLVSAVVAGPMAGGVIGGVTRAADSDVMWWEAAFHWLTGDGLGVLAVGAPILAMRGVAMPRGRRLWEAVATLCGTLILTALIYWVWGIPPTILLLPPLVWVALRFGTPGVLVVSAGVAAVANVATAAGHGLFATLDVSPQTELTMGQLYLATMIVTVWFLAVETSERAGIVAEHARQRVVLEQAQFRRTIGELGTRLLSAVSLDDVVRAFGSVVAERFEVSVVSLGRYDSELDRFRVVSDSLPDTTCAVAATWSSGTPAPGPVAMRLGAPIWVCGREELVRRFPAVSERAVPLDIEAVGVLPLAGVDRGYILVGRRQRPFDDDERDVLMSMSRIIAEAVERVELFDAEHAALAEAQAANAKVTVLLAEAKGNADRLRESEDRFRRLADEGPLMVWVHDAYGNQEWVNDTFCEFFGVDRNTMKAGQWQILVHPDDVDGYVAAFALAVTERRRFHASARVRDRHGDWRWVDSWAQPRFEVHGRFLGHVGASADVTDRRRAEVDLATAHAFVTEVTSLVPGVISVLDLETGRNVFTSRQTLVTLGYDPDEVIALGEGFVSTVLHPDDAGVFAANLDSVRDLSDGEATSIDYRFRHKDGSWRWFRTVATPLRRTIDGIVAQVASLSIDVTEQKAHEAEMAAAALLDALRARLADALQDLAGTSVLEAAAAEILAEHLGSIRAHFVEVDQLGTDRTVPDLELAVIPGALVSDVEAWSVSLARLVRDGKVVAVNEITSDPRVTVAVRRAATAAGIASVVAHPLRVGQRATRVLVVVRSDRHAWQPHELKMIEETSERTFHAVERDHQRQTHERQRRRAALIADVAVGLEAQTTVAGAAQELAELLVRDLADYATVETFGAEHQLLGLAHRNPEHVDVLRELRTRHRLHIDDAHAAEQVARSRQPQLLANITASVRAEFAIEASTAALLAELATCSHITIPIDLDETRTGALLVGLSDTDRDPYTHDDLDFLTDLARRVEIMLATSRLRQREHQIAITLQHALLPDETRWHPAAVVEARYQAASDHLQVGGDWFDTYAWPDHIGVMVGDVVGHSLASAAAMGRLRAAASALATAGTPSPAALATALDRFAHSPDGVNYATAAIVIVDPTTGTLTYTCAGHPPPLVITPDRQVIRLDRATSPPLGAFVPTARNEATLALEPGSLVVLYTDGLIERRRQSIDLGLHRLRTSLLDRFDQSTADIVEGIISDLTADQPAEDDIAVAVFRYTPVLAALHLEIPARADQLAELRSKIRLWLTERHIGPNDHASILTAIGEACTNAIDHAYRATHHRPEPNHDTSSTDIVTIDLSDHGPELVARVVDLGTWRPFGPHSADRGFGTDIMRALSRRYERSATDHGGTIITLSLPVSNRRQLVDR